MVVSKRENTVTKMTQQMNNAEDQTNRRDSLLLHGGTWTHLPQRPGRDLPLPRPHTPPPQPQHDEDFANFFRVVTAQWFTS